MLLLCSKPTGKPKYNCPFCDGTAPFDDKYDLYTIGDLYTWHQVYLRYIIKKNTFNLNVQKYDESGAQSRQQQFYQNVVNPPLITGPPDRVVLDLLNCPSLHILIGTKLVIYNSTVVIV